MGGPALLDVDPTHAINFDLVIGKTLESSLFIRNPRSSPIVFKVPLKRLRAFCTVLAARAQTIARSAPPSTSLRLPAAPSASSMRIITHFRTVRAIPIAPEKESPETLQTAYDEISAALAARDDIDDTGEAMAQLDEDGEEEDGD